LAPWMGTATQPALHHSGVSLDWPSSPFRVKPTSIAPFLLGIAP
jgi:hypothetical protein